MNLKHTSSISSPTQIRTYTGLTGAGWNIVHDKDLDSTIWYSMQNGGAGGSNAIYRYTLPKGGTTATVSTIFTYLGGTGNTMLGQAYIPACAWSTSAAYGALMTGGYQASVVHVVEFNATKLGALSTYKVAYLNEVYGVEFVPAKASGFTTNFGVAYTRLNKTMSSWRVDLDSRSWTDRKDNIYSSGVTGPSNGDGMLYYPPGKPIFFNDPDTSTNRIAMNDTSSANLYVWTITQSTVALNWTFLKTVPMANNGGYPYHMSLSTYNAIA